MVNVKKTTDKVVEGIEDAIKKVIGDVAEDTAQDAQDDTDVETDEAEVGIFDEDLAAEDVASDFDIGSTMLSAGSPVQGWQGQNLEETIGRERIEKDWGTEEEFVGGDVYKSAESSSEIYGTGTKDVYASGGSDVYSSGGSDAYSSGKSDEGYAVQSGNSGGMKSYDQLADDRRGGRSMLEVAGFEDKDKRKERELRSDLRFMGKSAA